jgi:myo-inositol-1(or 4)-monophosphatase
VEIALESVIELALEAGRFALEQGKSQIVAELKPDDSYVTQIDRHVEAMLREALGRLHPEAGFWGEESGREREQARDLWVVDPIDGTTNMVAGLPHWGVSIGLLREGRPVIGVIHLPLLAETYWAAAGEGAFRNGEPIAAPPRPILRPVDVLCLSTECFWVLEIAGFPGRVRNLGSAAAHGIYTARGSFCGFVTRDDKLHDLAGALCIAAEAGCVAEYLRGGEVDLHPWIDGAVNTEPIVIAPPATIPALRAALPRRS